MYEFIHRLERICMQVLVLLLALVLVVSLVELGMLLVHAIMSRTSAYTLSTAPVDKEHLFLATVQGFIAGALLITILVELIRSITEYLKRGSAEYVAVMFEIALIAVVRHLLAIDFEHVEPLMLPGLALLLGVLAYFNLRMTAQGHGGTPS